MIVMSMNLLSGFLIQYNDLYAFFKGIYWIDPFQYMINSLASSQLFCRDTSCSTLITATGLVYFYYNNRWLIEMNF